MPQLVKRDKAQRQSMVAAPAANPVSRSASTVAVPATLSRRLPYVVGAGRGRGPVTPSNPSCRDPRHPPCGHPTCPRFHTSKGAQQDRLCHRKMGGACPRAWKACPSSRHNPHTEQCLYSTWGSQSVAPVAAIAAGGLQFLPPPLPCARAACSCCDLAADTLAVRDTHGQDVGSHLTCCCSLPQNTLTNHSDSEGSDSEGRHKEAGSPNGSESSGVRASNGWLQWGNAWWCHRAHTTEATGQQ
jgi:hypothetical protein